jgi:ABC-type multidrug transport system ATPase subunit
MELTVKDICKSYGSKKAALSHADIVFTPGIYGLLGPNGAGKSTLMNIITDNIKADSGQVFYNGTDIHSLGDQYRACLGYMPQQQVLYDNFTGEEFLWYMAALKGMQKSLCRNRISELLHMVNLWTEKDKKIGSYSGGMKQRILIAQAMLNDPEILIMDEPTAGLDPSERIRIRNFLSTIAENKIIIIATHIVSDIEFIAKEIVLLKNGEIADTGEPQKLLQKISDKVYEIEVGMNEEYQCEGAKIANIRMGVNEKIYRVLQNECPKNCNYQRVKAGLEELYLYYFL